jgi:multidrug efflux system outer membrane protein
MGNRLTISGLILLSLALALGGGCRLGEDYERPELDIPEVYRGEQFGGDSLAILAWWQLFDDPVLKELISVALEENKDLLIATSRIEEARGAFKATRSREFPEVNAVAGAELEQASKEFVPGADVEDAYGVGVALAWELDLWGELRSASEAAMADLFAAEEARRGVVVTLVSEVARVYFNLRDLDNQLEISQKTVETRRKALDIARMRFEGGITSELEVKQMEVELYRAETDIPAIQHEIAITENALSILLGRNPEDIDRGLALKAYTLPPEIPVGLPSELLKRRPDIRRAEQELIAANADVRIALAQFYPQIMITGTAGQESDKFRRLARGDAFTWNAALDGVLRVFDAGRNQGNLEVAQARYDQALIRYEQTVQESFREVSDALSFYQSTREIREREEAFVESTRAYRELAVARYLHGDVAFLEILDADRQLFNAQISLSRTVREQLVSMVLLYRALGGGWQAEQETL